MRFTKNTSAIIFLIFLVSCSKSDRLQEENSEKFTTQLSAKMAEAMPDKFAGGLGNKKRKREGRLAADDAKKDGDYQVRFSKISDGYQRLLEYTVDLSFETKDFSLSRDDLYKLAQSYGFIQSSNDSFHKRRSLSATLWVESAKLYDFLQEVNKLGTLKSEAIHSNDLTFPMFEQSITLHRENIRIRRRNRAVTRSATSKNAAEQEKLLAQSENKEDAATKEKWQIKDKVKWAKVQVHVADPQPMLGVKVPNYMKILYGLANLGLSFLYGFLYLLPFFSIALILWFKRKRILSILKKDF